MSRPRARMTRRPAKIQRPRSAAGLALAGILTATGAWAAAPMTVLAASTLSVPSAFATIQSAIDAAADGDVVLVGPGTYAERIDFLHKDITVESASGAAATTIDGGGGGVVVKIATDPAETPILRGFTIRNGGDGADDGGIDTSGGPALIERNVVTGNTFCDGGAIEASFSAATILDNTISSNRQVGCSGGSGGGGVSIRGAGTVQLLGNVIDGNAHGSWGGGVAVFAGGSARIERNVIRNNTAGSEGGGVSVVNDSPVTVRNNLFVANSAPAGGAIDVSVPSGSTGADIANNTFVGNTAASGSAIATGGFAGSVAIYNNLVVGAGPGGLITCDGLYSANPPQISYNDVVATSGSGFAGICPASPTNISVAPTFVAAAAGDYHLAAGSAGIDGGSISGAPTTDIDGDLRPLDGDGDGVAKVDIGFDETPVAPPPTLAVAIDVLPGTSPNVVKLSGKGLTITVGLLGTPTFDPRTAVTSSLCFGDAEAPAQRDCTLAKPAAIKDLDRDGDLDLSLVFDTAQSGIDAGDQTACLQGRTTAGRAFLGCDAIVTR
jgi:hypothetical protein